VIPASDVVAIEEMLAAYEGKRARAVAVRDEAEKQVDALGEIVAGLKAALAAMEGCPRSGSGADQKTNYERIVDFLASVENRPQTIPQLETGTGIARSSISAVLYRTHADKFAATEQPGKAANLWHLKGLRFGVEPELAASNGEDIPF
jgi:hypothetical protein